MSPDRTPRFSEASTASLFRWCEGREESVLVPVILMGGVAMTVVDEIGVVTVAHGHVPAVGTVQVVVAVMSHVSIRRALVPVVIVGTMGVPVMQVVGVVLVVDGDVPAVRTVVMAMSVVGAVGGSGHDWCSSVVGS